MAAYRRTFFSFVHLVPARVCVLKAKRFSSKENEKMYARLRKLTAYTVLYLGTRVYKSPSPSPPHLMAYIVYRIAIWLGTGYKILTRYRDVLRLRCSIREHANIFTRPIAQRVPSDALARSVNGTVLR